MATHDYIISNASGAAVRADLNNALAAIATNNSSATEPTTTYAYQWWADTGSSPTVMKLRNAANSGWVTLFQLDGEWTVVPFENGTAAAPSIYFKDSGTDTGFFSPGVDSVAITTGGTQRVTVDSSGRVGIGTTGAVAPLHVHTASSNTTFAITRGTVGAEYGYLLTGSDGATTPGLRFFPVSNGVQGSEVARIDSSGRLIVGATTSIPVGAATASNVQIAGDTSFQSLSRWANNGNGPALVLGKSRSATVGTYSIVSSGDTLGQLVFAGDDGTDIQTVAATIKAEVDGTPGANDMPGRLVFSTTADGASSVTERMRIAQNGTVTFNSDGSTPNASTSGFSFIGSGVQIAYSSASGAGSRVFEFGGNAGYARIMGDGDLENTNNRYTGISDIKLKQNIEDASSQWDDFKAIQVRKYELIAHPERKHIGVIAQELEQVCPGLVVERIQDEETGETVKSVAYSVLYMKAVKALQEAMERIETLEVKVAALEAQ